nr:MAG TPA: hypothetical protein [Caudoviricetes sp.]
MKQLSSFMVLNIDGGDRVTYTYNKIDDSTGEPISRNNKGNFYVVDDELKVHIDAIRNFVKDNKLND